MMKLLWRYLTRKLRTLPDFLVIGTEKSGTTSIYNYLIKHPQIAKPLIKEIHFFDRKFGRGYDWYRMSFPLKTFRKRVFEVTASYFKTKEAPMRIFKMNGQLKLIVLFRNPLDRAYSHWNEFYKSGMERNDFLESGYLDYYLTLSRYDLFLEKWLRHFTIANFWFVKAEDFFRDTRFHYDQICKFLNLKILKDIKFQVYNYRGSKVPDDVRESFDGYFDKTYEYMKKFTGISWKK